MFSRYQQVVNVDGPVMHGRAVPHAAGKRKHAKAGMYVVTAGPVVTVVTAEELEAGYEPVDLEHCSQCGGKRAHGDCPHVLVNGDQVVMGRQAWEVVCDELALNRARARAHP